MQTTLYKFSFWFICFLYFSGQILAQTPLVHQVAISPDNQKIAFSYQGDIWTMPINGKTAQRLTVHEGYESAPIWSENSQEIIFTGKRLGNSDIFRIDVTQGKTQRLTYRSSSDMAYDVTDNQVFFSTRRDFRQVQWEAEINVVSLNGGTPYRFIDALGDMPQLSPNGRYLAFVKGACRITREAYKGSANRDIWILDTQNQTFTQITNFEGQDFLPKWTSDNQLIYLSAQNGKYNLFAQKITEGKADGSAQALTTFTDDGIRHFDANSQQIVFERQDKVFKMPVSGGQPTALEFTLPQDNRFEDYKFEKINSASNFELSPNEKYIAFEQRGEIFIKPNDSKKSRAVNVSQHPFRERNVTWLDDETLIFASDRNGNYDLFLLRSADPNEKNLYKTLKYETLPILQSKEDELNFTLSNDRNKIAYLQGNGKLVVGELDKNGKISAEKTLLDGWATPQGIVWSPDDRWLAYSLKNLNFNAEVYVQPIDKSQEPINVSLHPKQDYNPYWSADGSKLGFLSSRNNGDADVWFVWLKTEDWERTKRDWEEFEEEEPKKDAPKTDDKKDKEKDKNDDKVTVQIDVEDIHERIVQVTFLPAGENDLLISNDGDYFYFVANHTGSQHQQTKRNLYKVKWDGSELKALTSGGDDPNNLRFDKKGKQIYGLKKGKLVAYDAKAGTAKNQGISASMKIDFQTEQTQIFNELWRELNTNFYDPNFHGQDWDKLGEKYKTWALKTQTHTDFQNIVNEMLGQVNASHMGYYGQDRTKVETENTGLLGIEIKPNSKGVEILRVIPNSPASRKDSQLSIGEVITSVNGQAITSNTNFYALFMQMPNEKVWLEVVDKSNKKREVIIRPIQNLRPQLYNEWVKSRKALVEKYSDGKLGYIHIQGMNWRSFERFERELTASGNGKKGIVIDVRFNGGGWTTDYLMAVMNVPQHAYTVPRGTTDNLEKDNKKYQNHYPFAERLPLSRLGLPSVALCNEMSYSNAEIFSHAYKSLELGTLVGKPTFGAVISTGGRRLLNGYVRMPFRAWYVKKTGENMEEKPAVPNEIVENPPAHKASGDDQQLQKAVQILLKQLGEK